MKKYAVISMDVEDWYQSYHFDCEIDKSVTVLDGLDKALEVMDARHIPGSFFVLGALADRLGEKLRAMDRAGHDIACHGWEHIRPLSLEPDEFRGQLLEAKAALEKALSHGVSGYRGPYFAMDDRRLDIVRGCGFHYDSSKLKQQKSDKYGEMALAGFEEVSPCVYGRDGFTEFEVSTQKIGGMNMLLGGGYLRMLPWPFMAWMLGRYLKTGKPYVLYIHPLDLSTATLPRVADMSPSKYLRMHIGRRHMARRLKKTIALLERYGYEFTTFERLREKL